MNRVVNIFSLFILVIFAMMMMVVVYDLSISNFHLKGMPYKREVFTGISVLILLLGLIRIQRRWQGMKDMKKYKSFAFVQPVSKKHLRFGVLFTVLETLFMLGGILFCTLFLRLEKTYVIPMMAVLAILAIESFIFIFIQLKGGNAFRVGFNDNIIAYFDREMHLFYYTGMQRVELHQNDLINFGYREELNLPFETAVLDIEHRQEFKEKLMDILQKKNVFIDDTFRTWK